MTALRITCLALLLLLPTTPPAVIAEEDRSWYPSRHGAEDTLGAINYLSPKKVLQLDDGVGAVQAVINPVAIR